MPKVKRKLTETEIKNAKPKDKAYKLYDEGGLLLLVRPSGTKVWQYPYRLNGKYNVFTIGQTNLVGSKTARQKRDEIKLLLKDGTDPNLHHKNQIADRREQAKNTFEAIARQWYQKQGWTPKHAKNILGRLEKDVFNIIGRKPIKDVTVRDILVILQKIEDRGALDVAKRINQYCTAIFDYAIILGICDNNPSLGRSKFIKSYQTQNRAHMKESDLPAFMTNLQEANNLSLSVLATKLLSLTCVRPSELRFARWEEFDLPNALWTIPPSRMKNRKEHLVPLSTQAINVINNIRKISGNYELLFPGQKTINQPISDVALIKAVRNLTNNKSTPHGFRHLFSTIVNERGFNHDHIERQLSHVERNKVRSTYNKALYLDDRRKLMQWWGEFLGKL